MTRLGYGAFGANSIQADGLGAIGGPTVVASPFTGGGPYALQVVSSASIPVLASFSTTFTTGIGYYLRARVRISGTPTADAFLMNLGANVAPSTASNLGLALASGSRVLRLWANGAVQGAAGPTLAVNTDYLLELYVLVDTAGNDTISGRVDGTAIDTVTAALTATLPSTAYLGLNTGAGITAHYTDWAVNDDQGATDNSWPGDARVAMLLPVSDDTGNSFIGADGWRLINSGTTNLFTGVNNTPPLGKSSPGSGTSQIVVDTPSTTRAYTAVTETYDSKIAAGDTITHVQGLLIHGEAINTGTKQGLFSVFANPTGTEPASFNFGNDGGADGAFPTGWAVYRGQIEAAPGSRSTGASVRVRALTSTRNSDVCFMGVYVEYQLAVAATYAPPPFQRRWRHLDRRRSA